MIEIEMETAHPPIVPYSEWLSKRKELLAKEKELTRQRDRLSAERRRLPMVKIEKTYWFDSVDGKVTLLDLFEGREQLIVYHFMFGPDWDAGCPGCTGFVNEMGDLTTLGQCKTSMVLVSRAPIEKLTAYKAEKGWTLPWVSSFGSDFNYDFHTTLDKAIAPIEHNYRNEAELIQYGRKIENLKGEIPGLSVFFRLGDEVYHTYSTFGRGVESLTEGYMLLDVTPYGRQENWEDSPPGWPQKPTYG